MLLSSIETLELIWNMTDITDLMLFSHNTDSRLLLLSENSLNFLFLLRKNTYISIHIG